MDELFIDPIQLYSLNIFIHQLQANNNMPCFIFLKLSSFLWKNY